MRRALPAGTRMNMADMQLIKLAAAPEVVARALEADITAFDAKR